MAVLKPQSPERAALSLAARSLVGRAPGAVVRLDDPSASAEHASIFWTGSRWEVRDLASRNGTWVDGTPLPAGKRKTIHAGAELQFGSSAETWSLSDELPPVASARRAGTEARVAEHGILVLPSETDPRVSVIETDTGAWLVEDGSASRPAHDQEELDAEGLWVLSVPPPAPAGSVATTRKVSKATGLGSVTLDFAVSRDEEHVELQLVGPDGPKPLVARAHHYLLLTLARARLAGEAQRGMPASEHGWLYVDELLDMLKIDAQHLSVMIYRARLQLAACGIQSAGALFERRPTSRQIRLGTNRVKLRAV